MRRTASTRSRFADVGRQCPRDERRSTCPGIARLLSVATISVVAPWALFALFASSPDPTFAVGFLDRHHFGRSLRILA